MATVEFARYKRIVQMFWDPEPTNDTANDQPVWCLGVPYTLADERAHDSTSSRMRPTLRDSSPPVTTCEAPSEQVSTSSSSKDACESHGHGGWPAAFLNDFGSRIWMTYRSGFDPIPKSTDPESLSALSFQMRVKQQLADSTGFASDSGWGCMIRSGQSLLANTIAIQRLGRGAFSR
jgi:cysteine protease ATG4